MSKKLKVRTGRKHYGLVVLAIIFMVLGILAFLYFKTDVFTNLIKREENIFSKEKAEVKEEKEKPKLKIIDLDSDTRPYAVMINNINVARPYQSGLQDAYLIYEIIAEGGITRMLALFKDVNVERIGTIRSARHYYLDYVLENDAIFVHWGWSPQAQKDIKSLGINNINGLTYSNTYFWKDKSLNVATEHTAYSSTELINSAISKLKFRTTLNKDILLNYAVEEVDLSKISNAIKADNIDINYSNSTKNHYEYDAENKYYKRSVNGNAHVDYVTHEQYHFKNIIVYQVKNSTISADDKGRQELDNIGSGNGYYISNGYAVPIKWQKQSRTSKTKYMYKDGEEIQVNDGNTFIQIAPVGQTLNIS